MVKRPTQSPVVVRRRKPKVIAFKSSGQGDGEKSDSSAKVGDVEERVRVGKWMGAPAATSAKKKRRREKLSFEPQKQSAAPKAAEKVFPKSVLTKKSPSAKSRRLTSEDLGPKARRWPEPPVPSLPEGFWAERRFSDAAFGRLQADLVKAMDCAVADLPAYFQSQVSHPAALKLHLRLCKRFGFGRRSAEAARVAEALTPWFHSGPYYAAVLAEDRRWNLDMAVEGWVTVEHRRAVRFYLAELYGDPAGLLIKRRGRIPPTAIPFIPTVAQAMAISEANAS